MPPRVEGQLSDALINDLSDPVICLDRVGVVRVFNKEAGVVLGVKPKDVIGKNLWDALPLSDFTRALIAHVKDSDPQPLEQLMVFPNDQLFAVKITCVRTERGRNLGAYAVLRDMAGMQKIERGLDQVLADLSRRISVPLTSIKGFVETLLEGSYTKPDITKSFLQIINEETNSLVRLIMTLEESLHTGSKITLSKHQGRIEETVSKVVEMFTPVALGKNVELYTKFQENLPWVEFDSAALLKAVVNVVDNAVRFTGLNGNGQVFIEVCQEGRSIIISVKDNGIGISPEDLIHVFDRFWRSSSQKARGLGGTGLGLAVAKEITEAHLGEICAESTLEKGSVFTIKIPIRTDD